MYTFDKNYSTNNEPIKRNFVKYCVTAVVGAGALLMWRGLARRPEARV